MPAEPFTVPVEVEVESDSLVGTVFWAAFAGTASATAVIGGLIFLIDLLSG